MYIVVQMLIICLSPLIQNQQPIRLLYNPLQVTLKGICKPALLIEAQVILHIQEAAMRHYDTTATTKHLHGAERLRRVYEVDVTFF